MVEWLRTHQWKSRGQFPILSESGEDGAEFTGVKQIRNNQSTGNALILILRLVFFPTYRPASVHAQSELLRAKQACHSAKPFHQGLRKRVICCLRYYANQGDAVHLPQSSGNSGNEDTSFFFFFFNCICAFGPLWTSYLQRAVLGNVKKNAFPSFPLSVLSWLSAFLHLLWKLFWELH